MVIRGLYLPLMTTSSLKGCYQIIKHSFGRVYIYSDSFACMLAMPVEAMAGPLLFLTGYRLSVNRSYYPLR